MLRRTPRALGIKKVVRQLPDYKPGSVVPVGRDRLPQYAGVLGAESRPLTFRERKVAEVGLHCWMKGNSLMKIATTIDAFPEGNYSMPEVIFVGRFNSGKSSVIRSLLGSRRIAPLRESKKPGTTQYFSVFNVGDAFAVIDGPGWGGFFRVSPKAQFSAILSVLKQYLFLRTRSPTSALKMVYLVLDAMKGIRERDKELIHFLMSLRIPHTVVFNKIDQLGGGKLNPPAIKDAVDRVFDYYGTDTIPLIEYSAERLWNVDALRTDIAYNCTRDLPDDRLSYEELHDLSYLPPTGEELARAEEMFPSWSSVLPPGDMPIAAFLEEHNALRRKMLIEEGYDPDKEMMNVDESGRIDMVPDFGPVSGVRVNTPLAPYITSGAFVAAMRQEEVEAARLLQEQEELERAVNSGAAQSITADSGDVHPEKTEASVDTVEWDRVSGEDIDNEYRWKLTEYGAADKAIISRASTPPTPGEMTALEARIAEKERFLLTSGNTASALATGKERQHAALRRQSTEEKDKFLASEDVRKTITPFSQIKGLSSYHEAAAALASGNNSMFSRKSERTLRKRLTVPTSLHMQRAMEKQLADVYNDPNDDHNPFLQAKPFDPNWDWEPEDFKAIPFQGKSYGRRLKDKYIKFANVHRQQAIFMDLDAKVAPLLGTHRERRQNIIGDHAPSVRLNAGGATVRGLKRDTSASNFSRFDRSSRQDIDKWARSPRGNAWPKDWEQPT